jgi:hypothetical protein
VSQVYEEDFQMLNAILLDLKLLVVHTIQTSEKAVSVVFHDGKRGVLSLSLKDYDYFLRLAQRSHDRQHPVGVSLSASGDVIAMARADSDIAAQLGEYDKDMMKVWFQGHDGSYFLRRDRPDFQRLSGLLNQSIKEKKRLWFVATPQLVLEDVAFGEQFGGPKQLAK